MKKFSAWSASEKILLGTALIAVAFGALGARYYMLTKELSAIQQSVETNMIASDLYQKELEREIAIRIEENTNLAGALTAKEEEVTGLSLQVQGISTTVGTLEKLSKTDPEFLKKYSKVFFLNEHYVPGSLVLIPSMYILSSEKPEQIHKSVSPFLLHLLTKAKEDGIELRIASAYRSFGEQSSLKSGYTVTYGSGANKFSADQGYSEHQLGTTVDFTTPELAGTSLAFEKTGAFTWLTDHAHEFGFVLSYPKGNAYYVFEPWHWRFVGVELATKLHNEGKHFYDLDQRDIDEYLVKLFDE